MTLLDSMQHSLNRAKIASDRLKRQLYLDIDGVFGDLDGFYEQLFGVRPNQDTYEPPDLWTNIRNHGFFFRDMPLMPNAFQLWITIKTQIHPDPIFLTGIPKPNTGITNAAEQKAIWVARNFGVDQQVICCLSEDKHCHGKLGDVLLDDRTKYAGHWIHMGGLFVRHRSVESSIVNLKHIYNGR